MYPVTNVVTVATAGTPVVLPDTPQGYRPLAIYIQSFYSNTAAGYLGVSTMVKATGAGVIKRLEIGIGDISIGDPNARASISARDYYLDADANNQSFLVTYWCN